MSVLAVGLHQAAEHLALVTDQLRNLARMGLDTPADHQEMREATARYDRLVAARDAARAAA